ncbi:uncharacterized protein [Linepithema humile]|uniref:uncharacterized protein n=1 Tax=Linepithema humile TaxID=83485 RepID=UPI00351ED3E9
MNRRPKRKNIKKPLRYETTESSDNEGESAKRYKEQNKTSVTDEIRNIRKNLSQYENEELAKQKAINSASKCHSASITLLSTDKSIHLPSHIDDSSIHGSQPIIASQLALNSRPFANTTPISHDQFPVTSVTNSSIVSQSSFCTISKPSCSSTIKHPSFTNSQTFSESQILSFPLTSMIDTEQIRNKKYDYEMNNNTECPIGNIEIPCQNATKHLSSYECLPVSSASHIPPLIPMTNNMVHYTPHHNRESTRNQKMAHLENTIESSSVISPESYTSSSPQSYSSSLSRDSETPSLTLLSAPVPHNNVTYNTQPNYTLTSNHEHPNPTITYHQNTLQENTNIINEIKMQVMECVRNVMTEFRTRNQCLHIEKINRRPVKPNIIPFHTVEAVLKFNRSDDTIYTEIVEYLASIGGRNAKEIIHLAFKEIFTTNVALSFTWTGKDNNNRSIKEKLSDQRIINALYDATSVHSKLTTAEFKYYVSEALRSAKQRHRHQQRMHSRDQNDQDESREEDLHQVN